MCWWCVQAEGRHISNERWNQDADGLRARVRGAWEAQPATLGTVLVMRSESKVEQHELVHLPFRRWCRHCVRAQGKESPHHESSLGAVSKFATDRMFMGEDGTPIIISAS